VVEHTVGQAWFQLRQCLNSLQATELRIATHQFFQRNEPLRNSEMYSKNSIFQCLNPSWRSTP
jgi:hypothetical protein